MMVSVPSRSRFGWQFPDERDNPNGAARCRPLVDLGLRGQLRTAAHCVHGVHRVHASPPGAGLIAGRTGGDKLSGGDLASSKIFQFPTTSMFGYLTRKSLRGKAIRRLRPQVAHPVSRRHCVTVT